jgi:hypothetical protein
MIAAMAAFSELALGAGAGPLGALGTAAGVDGCAAGLLKATDCANADGEVIMAETGALLTGALWRPSPKCRQPQENQYRPAPHRLTQPEVARTRKLCRGRDTGQQPESRLSVQARRLGRRLPCVYARAPGPFPRAPGKRTSGQMARFSLFQKKSPTRRLDRAMARVIFWRSRVSGMAH